jgi:hypothetical protein
MEVRKALDLFVGKTIAYFEGTSLYHSINGGTQQGWQKEFNDYASNGKLASDFVGMLTSLVFCLAAGLFFLLKTFRCTQSVSHICFWRESTDFVRFILLFGNSSEWNGLLLLNDFYSCKQSAYIPFDG